MIKLKRLQKVDGHNTVVDIEAFHVKPGEIAGIVGPVDSGRETLLKLLIGRERPTLGEVLPARRHPYPAKGFVCSPRRRNVFRRYHLQAPIA